MSLIWNIFFTFLFLCLTWHILSHIQHPLHSSSHFFSVSQWKVNNSYIGCMLVEMNHVRRAGYTCSSESNSQKTPAVYEDWLHTLSQYCTDLSHSIPACMTVTRELNTSFSALRTRARSHPEKPRSSFSLYCLFSRCLCVQADIITCLSNSCFHSQNEFRTNSDHF